MKSILALALLSLAFCNIFNGELNDYLKVHAPFEVYEPEENPFRDYTEEEIKALLTDEEVYPELEEEEELLDNKNHYVCHINNNQYDYTEWWG